MELYFRVKLITQYGIPVILIVVLMLSMLHLFVKGTFKSRLMEKLGYTYQSGLGSNVAYEFQSHWVKGNTRINCREINSTPYRKIRSYVASKERR
jgi:predicted membrane protein